jgi:hypothetical protein
MASDESLVRVPLDAETLGRLREVALAERRATSDQAAVILTRALARRSKPGRADDPKALAR